MKIGAVVLAAGMSVRMGAPKMVLPWGKSTVIGTVASTLALGGVERIVVVTGGADQMIRDALHGTPVQIVYNPDYSNGEMICSLQKGLAAQDTESAGVLVVLGDQPQMQVDVVQQVLAVAARVSEKLVLPSYIMRRGHPWFLPRRYWDEIREMPTAETLRDFMGKHRTEIEYVSVDTDSILADLDTPEDYTRQRT